VTNSPRWPLPTVKALVASGSFSLSRSVVDEFDGSRVEASDAFTVIIENLTIRSFAYQLPQREVFDVYGIMWAGTGRYLKFTVIEASEGEQVLCISLHPPTSPLRTRGGIIK
jgi:hypothetical protein